MDKVGASGEHLQHAEFKDSSSSFLFVLSLLQAISKYSSCQVKDVTRDDWWLSCCCSHSQISRVIFSVCCEAVVGHAKDSASQELLLLWDDWLHFDICLLICLHHSFLSINHRQIWDILQPQMADLEYLSPSIHLNRKI